MGVTGLRDSHARVLAIFIPLLSRVYVLKSVPSYKILEDALSKFFVAMVGFAHDDLFRVRH